MEFREAVLGLEVTPHISKDNNILLDLLVSQNSQEIAWLTGKMKWCPLINKKSIHKFCQRWGNSVLGGVFHDTITKGVDKVPLLGDIPGIKRLFSKESGTSSKRACDFCDPSYLEQGERMEMAKKEKHFRQVEKSEKIKCGQFLFMFSHFSV